MKIQKENKKTLKKGLSDEVIKMISSLKKESK